MFLMEKQKKDKVVGVRFSPDEIAELESACREINLPLATYIRTVVLRDIAQAKPSDPIAKAKMDKQIQEFGETLARMFIKASEEADKGKKKGKTKKV
jgi:hypothetical protein